MNNNPDDSYLPRRIEDFAQDAEDLDIDAFRVEHGNAFLVYYGSISAWRKRTGIVAADFEEESTTEMSPLSQPGKDVLVFPVRRTGRSVAGDLVTLGRTRNNDIVIFDSSISRVHSYFSEGSDGRFFVMDAGSRNGTFVNEQRLEPKRDRTEVGPWIRVRFGSVETVFHSAVELYGLAKR